MEDRARGVMLGLLTADALGAAVEGWSPADIRELAKQRGWEDGLVHEYIPAVHMGLFTVKDGKPVAVREGGSGVPYIGVGPPRKGFEGAAREGMYTDDGNTALALAASLVEKKGLDPEHAARNYAHFWKTGEPRGYPDTAKRVMELVLSGAVPYREAGSPPNFPFPGGSFANGGAMRISPIAIPYRNADADTLRKVVKEATCSSHVHPEAIDGAVVQAAAVQYALHHTPASFDAKQFVTMCLEHCETEGMQQVLNGVLKGDPLPAILSAVPRKGSGIRFQIASVHMTPCVIDTVARYYANPSNAVKQAVDLGGDTDTTASMVGAVMGALHGTSWIPSSWVEGLENGDRGKDFALSLASSLASLDLTTFP